MGIAPDRFEPAPQTLGQAIAWALDPAPEPSLLELVAKGGRDGRAWVAASGVLGGSVPVPAPATAGAARR